VHIRGLFEIMTLLNNHLLLVNELINEENNIQHVPKINGYVEDVVNFLSLDDFKSFFRLTRSGFEKLIIEVIPHLPEFFFP
jgi:hypothetical protein